VTGPARRLIVNADDLGYTPLTSAGIFAARRDGIVTSASLMVRRPDSEAAAARAAAEGFADLGLHLDLGEWTCLGGRWRKLYGVVPMEDPAAVREECERQVDEFQRLVGRPPTHLDSHQHVHRDDPVRPVAREIAARLGIVLRDASRTVSYAGGFYGQYGDGRSAAECLSVAAILGILRASTAEVIELGCHPGLDSALETMYCHERRREVEVLCTPGFRERLAAAGFTLVTFDSLGPQPAPETTA
jgi:predicted glycoside hydrolase/deacetylase ChbG (UPF0249 family)